MTDYLNVVKRVQFENYSMLIERKIAAIMFSDIEGVYREDAQR